MGLLEQMDRQVLGNQADIVVAEKNQKTEVEIDASVPSDSNIRKKVYEKLEKYRGLNDELEKMWKVEAKEVSMLVGLLGTVTSKLGEWLQ